MTDIDEVVDGTMGQAPIKASKLRQMLFDAKAEVVILAEKLQKSERQRADQANKMAAHKDTRERAAALDDLVFNRGKGVILHIRRPDETQVYPIIVHKGALSTTPPGRWIADIVDPVARVVLAQGEEAEAGWITSDPNRDAKVREDHDAIRKALGALTHTVAPAVQAIVESNAEMETRVRSATTSAGKWQASAEKHEARIAELLKELEGARTEVLLKDGLDVVGTVLEGLDLSPEDAEVAANVVEAVRPAAASKAMLIAEEKKLKAERKARTKERRAKRAKEAKEAEKKEPSE